MNLVFSTGFLAPQMFGSVDYYRGLPSVYPDALFPTVPIVGSILDRARALAEQITAKFPSGPVHIIAHSMGGLDSRCLISQNVGDLASRVASLSTISTPHLGSAVADFVNAPPDPANLPARVLYDTITAVVQAMGMPVGALANLTTGYCTKFDAENVDRPGVRYFCYAGAGLSNIFLKPTHAYLVHVGKTPEESTNDGMVSLASAKHHEFTEPPWTDADHVTEVGWQIDRVGFRADFKHQNAIARIVARLQQVA
jgi:triacylglycerol lipase